MSTYDDKKDVKGRSWDQVTKDGTSSAGSMGVGGTGDSGKLSGGSEQAAGRTDDLLDDGADSTLDKGFSSSGGRVDVGMQGMGRQGNRQSGEAGASDDSKPENKDQQNR